jgi:peptidyl-tRNA hydrolase, PTH1 family
MLIFAGLGNPGSRYAGNRHNIGFLAVDEVARQHRATPWRHRFQGEACEAVIGTEKVILLKPMTYMNESGRSVGEAMRFFKLTPAEVVVFHDELDLAPAQLRVKTGGGNAGHNGLRSITAHITNDYRRVRIGIGHPGDKALVHAWVLNDFAKAEMPWVEDLCTLCATHAPLLTTGADAKFQGELTRAMADKGHGNAPAPAQGKPAPVPDGSN